MSFSSQVKMELSQINNLAKKIKLIENWQGI